LAIPCRTALALRGKVKRFLSQDGRHIAADPTTDTPLSNMSDPSGSTIVSMGVARWLPRYCATIIGQWIAPDLPLSANRVNGYMFRYRKGFYAKDLPVRWRQERLAQGNRDTDRDECYVRHARQALVIRIAVSV